MVGSVGILIESVGTLIHWHFERFYFENWYFEPLSNFICLDKQFIYMREAEHDKHSCFTNAIKLG